MQNYPEFIKGSGYILSVDNDFSSNLRTYMVTAKKLANGSITFKATNNFMKPAGTPWVRCLTLDDAKKLGQYIDINLFSEENCNAKKSKNTQILKFLGLVDDVPVYVATGDYGECDYILDPEDDTIKSFKDLAEKNPYMNLTIVPAGAKKSEEDLLKYSIQNWMTSKDPDMMSYIQKLRDDITSIGDKYTEIYYSTLQWGQMFDLQFKKRQIRFSFEIYASVLDYSDLFYAIKNIGLDPICNLDTDTSIWAFITEMDNDESRASVHLRKNIYIPLDIALNNVDFKSVDNDSALLAQETILVKNIIEYLEKEFNHDIANYVIKIFKDINYKYGEKDDVLEELITRQTANSRNASIDEDYKWLYDTLIVWVTNTYEGNGWEAEIPVINNNISDSIKDYKKVLGKGYWIEYLKPGKMHYNKNAEKDMTEDINNKRELIYNDPKVRAFKLSKDDQLLDVYDVSNSSKSYILVETINNKFIIELWNNELYYINDLSKNTYTDLGILGYSIVDPYLYMFIKDAALDISPLTQNPTYLNPKKYYFDVIEAFRDKFKSRYNEAAELFNDIVRQLTDENLWAEDRREEYRVASLMISAPYKLIIQLNKLSNESGWTSYSKSYIKDLADRAEAFLDPTEIVENKALN